MPSQRLTWLLAGGLLLASAASVRAQTLGDIGKKEEERRKGTPAGKVYTNQDLKPVPVAAVDSAAQGDSEKAADESKAADDKSKPAKSDKTDDKAEGDKTSGGAVKDQKHWRDRIAAARVALDRDTGYADAMQTRINALTTDFVNRDDPSQRGVIERDRQKALSELERLRKQIDDDKKAISDIEEEARRAGVPAGWLR